MKINILPVFIILLFLSCSTYPSPIIIEGQLTWEEHDDYLLIIVQTKKNPKNYWVRLIHIQQTKPVEGRTHRYNSDYFYTNFDENYLYIYAKKMIIPEGEYILGVEVSRGQFEFYR